MCLVRERCVNNNNEEEKLDENCNTMYRSTTTCEKTVIMRNLSEEKGKTRLCSKSVRYFSAFVIATTVLYMAFCPYSKADDNLKSVVFLHLLSFAAHCGAQFWVTFIAGITMFLNLPRIMFGRVQSRLFPLYFATTLLLSCVTFVTFTIRHPYDTLTQAETTQLFLLGACVILTFVNSFVMAPEIVDSMINVFEMERASGIAYTVGYCDRSELKKDPKYCKYYKQFRMSHSISGVANIVTLVCNVLYLYYLASV